MNLVNRDTSKIVHHSQKHKKGFINLENCKASPLSKFCKFLIQLIVENQNRKIVSFFISPIEFLPSIKCIVTRPSIISSRQAFVLIFPLFSIPKNMKFGKYHTPPPRLFRLYLSKGSGRPVVNGALNLFYRQFH